MRYRYYRTGSPITDDIMPGIKTRDGFKVYKPVGQVRCVEPYFSEALNDMCYGYVEYDTADHAFPPPAIMHDGWSPLYAVMDASDTRGRRKYDSTIQR